MRIAAVVALFVVVLLLAIAAAPTMPVAGQTIPPIPTPMPTPNPLTPQPGCDDYCMPGPTPVPNIPTPNIPPLEPTAEVDAAFPGIPVGYGYLVFCPSVGNEH